MRTPLPTITHDRPKRKLHLLRCYAALGLVGASIFLAAASAYSVALRRPPFMSWIPDQRITSATAPTFATQYFRLIDYDAPNGVSFMRLSSNPAVFSMLKVNVGLCVVGVDTACTGVQDGTYYKVSFTGPALMPGATTITLTANGKNGGASGYVSFTLRWVTVGSNPPTIEALPNQALQLPSTNGTVTYSTMFVIGDVKEDGKTEDVSEIGTSDFTVTSSNPGLLPNSPNNISLVQMPPPAGYIDQATPREYLLEATTVAGQKGTTTVTVEFSDPDSNLTSTSFVLQAIDSTNSPPTISAASDQLPKTYLPHPVPTPAPSAAPFKYVVTSGGDGADLSELRVLATSSNPTLVPNDFVNNLTVTQPSSAGTGTITVVPVTPLPLPSPGVPQTATITLNVTDDKYSRQSSFLYVASAAQGGIESAFSRPNGVYLLDPDVPSGRRLSDLFLTGEMHRISWNEIEQAAGAYLWSNNLDNIFTNFPFNQDVSLNLIEEPCYLTDSTIYPTTVTWCDTDPPKGSANCSTCMGGNLRAVPWDVNLLARRETYIGQLASHLQNTIVGSVSELSKISIINTNLPGGDSGIRNADGHKFSATQGLPNYTLMPGYSRQNLLAAIQHELRTVQDAFLKVPVGPIQSAPLLQIGFFLATDDKGPVAGGGDGTYSEELWQWLYKDASQPGLGNNNKDANGNQTVALADEFNGVVRPRVAFFQEDLAAARAPNASAVPNYVTPNAIPAAYTFTPNSTQLPTFAYWANLGDPTNAAIYNNAIVYQANTPWSSALASTGGVKLNKTLNGTPNDGMEGVYNAYLSEYLEIYPGDIDEAQPPSGSVTQDAVLWRSELQSWHDYYRDQRALSPRSMEAPAGLTITYQDSTHFLVSWYAMYGANSYTVQSKGIGMSPAQEWAPVAACDPASTSCSVAVPVGTTQYSFRVQGKNTLASPVTTSGWANAAIFLSEGLNDGYLVKTGNNNYSAVPSGPEPGIKAGEGTGMPLPHWRGILSFNTGSLSSTATTVLGAKLRLHQTTPGITFASKTCMVDVQRGSFGGNAGLDGSDYTASDQYTTIGAFNIFNAPATVNGGWFEMVFPQFSASSYVGISASPNDHTQFRIYFAQASMSNKNEGWDSGDSTTSPPQLIVQYQ